MRAPLITFLIAMLLHGHACADVTANPLASKGDLIFLDDFSRPELGKKWRILWPGFTVVDGALKASQTQPEHSAVGMVPVGGKDIIIDFKFQLNDATSINAVFNDRDYKEGHGRHICRVSFSPRQIFFVDDKERLRNGAKDVAGRSKSVSNQTESDSIVPDFDRDRGGQHACNIGWTSDLPAQVLWQWHPMKTDFYFAVSGEGAVFDDLHIWNAVPAAAK
ncbi:MAG: hypothetical protein JWO08_4017 [Verrucomicrobiaceae bacterium]|nr:hypothetical protein [Verrucomicrobiaceae bacterium]